MQYSGVVKSISGKDWGNKTLWSFQLNGDRSYFRCGESKPRIEEGNYIVFDAVTGKDGKSLNVTRGSIQVKSAETEETGVKIAYKASATSSKDDYWERKELRDREVQARIERQATRNSALEFIKILLSQEAIKFPAKADKVEVLENLLSDYQQRFIEDNTMMLGEEPSVTEVTVVSDEVSY